MLSASRPWSSYKYTLITTMPFGTPQCRCAATNLSSGKSTCARKGASVTVMSVATNTATPALVPPASVTEAGDQHP
eukprot:7156286-Pyramimonas_sp.AAC.1